MLKIVDRGIVWDATQQPAERQVACFISLCQLQSGRIICGFQNGPRKNAATSTIRVCSSTDHGKTWETWPGEFGDRMEGITGSLSCAELVEISPDRLLLFATWFDRTEPERPLFDPVTEGILRSKLLMAASTDEGKSWSDWRVLSTGQLKGCASTGPVLRWSDGTLAVPFESFKEYDDPRPCVPGSWMIVSADGGQTFSEPMLVAQDPHNRVYYWDQRLCTATSGDSHFFAFFWSHDRNQKQDLPIHLRRGEVRDGRIQATDLETTTIPGQIAAPLQLNDGRVLAFVVDRGQPCTMALWCSDDRGRSWPDSKRLVVYTHDEQAAITQGKDDIDYQQFWEDMGKWSFGHPAIRVVDEQHVLVAWYAGTPNRMSVHWARIRTTS